jgi:hypothetical protein
VWQSSDNKLAACVADAAAFARTFESMRESDEVKAEVKDAEVSLRMNLRSILAALRKKYAVESNDALIAHFDTNVPESCKNLRTLVSTLETLL